MKSDRATILGMFERPTTGGLLGETPPAPIDTFDPASLEIDDRTVRYIVQARETYADLRHCSAQLASLLLLAAVGGGSDLAEHPTLGSVRDGLAAIRGHEWSEDAPPLALAHRDHLRRATALLNAATREAGQKGIEGNDRRVDRLVAIVKEAWSEMHAAALAIPGFQVMSFGQSCCAVHAAQYQHGFQAG